MGMADKIREAVERTAERQSVLPDPRRAKRVFPDPPAPPFISDTGYSQAMAAMVDTEYIKTTAYSDQQYRADAYKAHPVIIEFTRMLIRRMRDRGVPLYAHCIWRDAQEQGRVFRAGHSKVEWPNSAHNRGCAVDIIHARKAWNLTPNQWSIIGHVGHEIAAQNSFKLVWGGDDKALGAAYDNFRWDPAHWELANWRAHAIARPEPSKRAYDLDI